MARAPRRTPPTRGGPQPRRRYLPVLVIALIAAVLAAGGAALLINIFERKQEARNPFYRVVELTDETTDPAVWGKNFPLQYDAYRRTVDQERTRFGGSEAAPRTPTQADPRSVVAQSRLEEDPRLHLRRIFGRTVVMPLCSRTRLSPSARRSFNSRARACTAMLPSMCHTDSLARVT
jgi:hypothetical protein